MNMEGHGFEYGRRTISDLVIVLVLYLASVVTVKSLRLSSVARLSRLGG